MLPNDKGEMKLLSYACYEVGGKGISLYLYLDNFPTEAWISIEKQLYGRAMGTRIDKWKFCKLDFVLKYKGISIQEGKRLKRLKAMNRPIHASSTTA